MEQNHRRVTRLSVNSASKQVNVIIMGIKFRGSTEGHRVAEKEIIKSNIS